MKRIIFVIIWLLAQITLFSQSLTVKSLWNNEPLEGVAIFNQQMNKSTLSDSNGVVKLNIFDKYDTLIFQHPSFERYTIPFANINPNTIIWLDKKNILIPEYVITASKHKENKENVPYHIDILSSKEIETSASMNSADLLTETGNIYIQKSQAGGGSPVLRGFEANRVLLVIDGVRMNNAIYRSGHLQNSLTIDNAVLDRVEVIYGPSSVIYGSDALGGVIHYITKSPVFGDTISHKLYETSAYIKGASATNSFKSHLDFNAGFNKIAFLTSLTYSNYGNIKIGKRRNPFYGDWGKQIDYVERIGKRDTVLKNSDPNKILGAEFNQIDLLEKIRIKTGKQSHLTANMQYSTSTNINRQDQLNNRLEDGLPEFSEWYYGPQERLMSALRFEHKEQTSFYNTFEATIAYQNIEESRITREFQVDTIYCQTENVQIGTINLDLFKNLSSRNSISYGLDINYNYVSSEAYKKNIVSNVSLPTMTRYPDEGTKTLSNAAYISYKSKILSNITTNFGLRFQHYWLNAKYGAFYDDLPEVFQDVIIESFSITSSASVLINQTPSFNWNLNFSTGFRSPNLDDLAKIRLTSGKLTLPNSELIPEYTYNVEFGFSKIFNGYMRLRGNYFFSYLTNIITRLPYTFENGSDSLYFQGRYRTTYQNTNSEEAYIHGFSFNLNSDLNSDLKINSTLNYTFGRNRSQNEPMAHIPPLFGRTIFSYKIKKFDLGISFIYSGWKHIEDMVTTGEDKEDEATEYGYPGWYTINFKSNYKVSDIINFNFAIENLTDNFYKPYATGVPAPGINFIGTLSIKI